MSARVSWSSRSRIRRNRDALRSGGKKGREWVGISMIVSGLIDKGVSVWWVSIWSVGSGIVFEYGGGGMRRLRAGLDIGFQRQCR